MFAITILHAQFKSGCHPDFVGKALRLDRPTLGLVILPSRVFASPNIGSGYSALAGFRQSQHQVWLFCPCGFSPVPVVQSILSILPDAQGVVQKIYSVNSVKTGLFCPCGFSPGLSHVFPFLSLLFPLIDSKRSPSVKKFPARKVWYKIFN